MEYSEVSNTCFIISRVLFQMPDGPIKIFFQMMQNLVMLVIFFSNSHLNMHYENVKSSKYILMKHFHFYPGESAKDKIFFFFSSIPSPSCPRIPLFYIHCFPMPIAAKKQLAFYIEMSAPEQSENYKLLTCM